MRMFFCMVFCTSLSLGAFAQGESKNETKPPAPFSLQHFRIEHQFFGQPKTYWCYPGDVGYLEGLVQKANEGSLIGEKKLGPLSMGLGYGLPTRENYMRPGFQASEQKRREFGFQFRW